MGLTVDFQEAFLLFQTPYLESSAIADIFTKNNGRVRFLVKGARRLKSQKCGLLQPFVPLWVKGYGRGGLITLTQIEARAPSLILEGKALISAWYLNELLARLLPMQLALSEIFDAYQLATNDLAVAGFDEIILRKFEKQLLQHLGYALPLTYSESGLDVLPEHWYIFKPNAGVDPYLGKVPPPKASLVFKGSSLIAIEADNYHNLEICRDARKLFKAALSTHLGDKPLQTRRYFTPTLALQKPS